MKIRLNRVVSLFAILIVVSYTGIFAGYHACTALIGCFVGVSVCGLLANMLHINSVKSYAPIWFALLLYLCLNSLQNMPKSFLYLILFGGGLLVMFRKIDAGEIKVIVKILKVIAIVIAISVLVQAYAPAVFYPFARRWFFYSNQYDTLCNLGIVCHQYSGLFYEVSCSAFILSVGCVICFVELICSKQRRIKDGLFVAILYIAVILTGKRSFMLIVPVILMMFWMFNDIERINLIKLAVLIGFIFILIWKASSIFALVERVLTKGQGNTIQLSSREQFWKLAFDMFKDNWLLGKGVNSFDIAFNKLGIREIVFDFAGAHNAYLQIFAEMGIIGAFLYLSAIFLLVMSGIKEALHCRRNNETNKMMYNYMAVLALLVIMAYGITGNVLHQPQQLFMIFLFLGILINLKRVEESDFYSGRLKKAKIVLR